MRLPKLSKKVLLSFGALGAAASIAGMGTFAAYTSTTSSSANATTGTVVIALGGGSLVNDLTVAATKVLPGDTISRAVDLSSTSTDALSSVKLTTTAPTSSVLNVGTKGLQLAIQSCSVAWLATANSGTQTGSSYTCADLLGPASVLSTGNVLQANSTLNNLAVTTTPGDVTATVDHLLIVMTLPTGDTATDVPNNTNSVINFSFTGTQRTAPTAR